MARATPQGRAGVGKLGGMNKPAPKLIEIFRAGTHVASDGREVTLTAADLVDLAAAYDPAKLEAPMVVGHPTTNGPAHGWIKSLTAEGDRLLAEPHQVCAQFAAAHNAGRFKKRSASLISPAAKGNPTPGKWYLRHVGFLGAAMPAVSGLRDFTFAADDEAVEFAFEDSKRWAFGALGRLMRRMRDRLIETDSLEVADQVLPDWDLKTIEDAARPSSDAAFSAPAADDQGAEDLADPRDAEFAAREAALAEREQALAARETERATAAAQAAAEAARAEAVEFAASLIQAGRLLPRDREMVVELLVSTGAQEAPLNFSAADGQVSKPAGQALRELLQAMPVQITFNERSGGAATDATSVDFAAPPGAAVESERLALHAKAKAHQQAHPGLSFLDAVKAVGG